MTCTRCSREAMIGAPVCAACATLDGAAPADPASADLADRWLFDGSAPETEEPFLPAGLARPYTTPAASSIPVVSSDVAPPAVNRSPGGSTWTMDHPGVTGDEGAPAIQAAPVPQPAPVPQAAPFAAAYPEGTAYPEGAARPEAMSLWGAEAGNALTSSPATPSTPPPAAAGPTAAAAGPAAPPPAFAPTSVSKYDRKAPAPGTVSSGRRVVLGSAALVLVIAGAGVAALVTTHAPGSTAQGQLLTQPDQSASPGESAAGSAGGSSRASGEGTKARRGRPAVAVAPAVGLQPYAQPVSHFLVRYFRAINHHDYRSYLRLFTPASRAALSESGFLAGYGTTRDSAPRLIRLTSEGMRRLAATVTFTSHQDAAASPGHASCLRWRITVYLIRHGTRHERYFIGNPPAGYAAHEHAC